MLHRLRAPPPRSTEHHCFKCTAGRAHSGSSESVQDQSSKAASSIKIPEVRRSSCAPSRLRRCRRHRLEGLRSLPTRLAAPVPGRMAASNGTGHRRRERSGPRGDRRHDGSGPVAAPLGLRRRPRRSPGSPHATGNPVFRGFFWAGRGIQKSDFHAL